MSPRGWKGRAINKIKEIKNDKMRGGSNTFFLCQGKKKALLLPWRSCTEQFSISFSSCYLSSFCSLPDTLLLQGRSLFPVAIEESSPLCSLVLKRKLAASSFTGKAAYRHHTCFLSFFRKRGGGKATSVARHEHGAKIHAASMCIERCVVALRPCLAFHYFASVRIRRSAVGPRRCLQFVQVSGRQPARSAHAVPGLYEHARRI